MSFWWTSATVSTASRASLSCVPSPTLGAPDVVHFHGVWEASLVRISSRCRNRGIPYVVRPCGMLEAWSLQQQGGKKRIALATTHRAYLRGAGALHTLNAHEREAVDRLGLGVPACVIPNGVFLEEVTPTTAPGAFRASEPRLGERRFVLFLSRLHKKKGLDLLADAWVRVAARLPGYALVVAGPREDDSIDIFRERIEAAGLTGTVIETGPVFGHLKTAALRECDLFVLPSREEGFSLAITEALALGTPVVITEECHFPEVAAAGAGWVVPLDVEAIAAGLERALRDTTARTTLGAAGARLVREHFTWPAITARCVELYDRLREMSETDLKLQVADFWDAASCGEIYARGRSDEERYEAHSRERYSLEPYLPPFARFAEAEGKDVLEVGVGMGADHVELARAKPRSLRGVDLTPRAIEHTRQRLRIFGLGSELRGRRRGAAPLSRRVLRSRLFVGRAPSLPRHPSRDPGGMEGVAAGRHDSGHDLSPVRIDRVPALGSLRPARWASLALSE